MKTYSPALVPRAREMRREMSEPERCLWYQCLRMLPYRFRRQRPFGPYIVDFYCASLKLVIEIDGDSHASPEVRAYDAERTAFLRACGLDILRFTNADVMHNLEGVIAVIERWLSPRPSKRYSAKAARVMHGNEPS